MNNLYKFIANSDVNSIFDLENWANQLKLNKLMLVTGLYEREFYSGGYFNWASKTIELYSMRPEEQVIYLSIRSDFLDENTIISRIESSNSTMNFQIFQRFSFKETKFLVFKSTLPFIHHTKLNFDIQDECGGANRKLSVPVSRILLVSSLFEMSTEVLKFSLLTGSVSEYCDIFPYPTNADSLAEYFNEVCKELAHES